MTRRALWERVTRLRVLPPRAYAFFLPYAPASSAAAPISGSRGAGHTTHLQPLPLCLALP